MRDKEPAEKLNINNEFDKDMQFTFKHNTPSQKRKQFNKLIDEKVIESYQSQLSINKPFASNEFAQHFSVCNPRMA